MLKEHTVILEKTFADIFILTLLSVWWENKNKVFQNIFLSFFGFIKVQLKRLLPDKLLKHLPHID